MSSKLGPLEARLERAGAAYRARKNPPGQRVIRYRNAGYERYRELMLAALDVVEVHLERPSRWVRPLVGANRDPRTDWMIALIDAWAVAGEVLTFYQDRIVNEGYLHTACEPFSLDQLLSEIGVRRGGAPGSSGTPEKPVSPAVAPPTVKPVSWAPVVPSQLRPPVPTIPTPGAATAVPLPAHANASEPYEVVIDPGAAAITDMAFQVMPQRPNGGRALVRAGTAVRSHRVDGGAPILFETSADLDARIEYNALVPEQRPVRAEPVLTRASVGLELAGTTTGLKPGDALLVLGERVAPDSAPDSAGVPTWLYGKLMTVEPNTALGCTLVTWANANEPGAGGLLNQAELGTDHLQSLRVFGFERLLSPFGETAKPLDQAPVAVQLALSKGGGVARWSAKARTWTRLLDGLPPRAVSAVAVGSDGTTWLGGAFGAARVASGVSGVWSVANAGLGALTVADFAWGADGALWLGTTSGQVFRTTAGAHGWSGLVGSFTVVADAKDRLAPVKTSLPRAPVTSVQPVAATPASATGQNSSSPAVLVATGLGVFGNPLDGRGWFPVDAATSGLGSSPIVDLQVLPTGTGASSAPSAFALAATASELVVFEWSPLEPPSPTPSEGSSASTVSATSGVPVGDVRAGPLVAHPGELGQLQLMETTKAPILSVLTSEGVYRWQPAETTPLVSAAFVPVTAGLDPKRPLQDLACIPGEVQAVLGGIATGNDGKNVWVLSPGPDWTWHALPGFPGSDASESVAPVEVATRVAVGANGDVLATAPLTLASDWPNFQVVCDGKNHELYVDTESKPIDLAPGSYVVVVEGTSARVLSLVRSEVAYRGDSAAFGEPGRVFRLIVKDVLSSATETFDPRQADVLVRSFELELATRVRSDPRPVCGSGVVFDGLVDGLVGQAALGRVPVGRLLAFSGQRPRLCVTLAGGLWSKAATAAAADARNDWEELGFGFESVTAVLSTSSALWAATGPGVGARGSEGTWQDRSTGLASGGTFPSVLALAGNERLVLAATSAGVFRWAAQSTGFTPVTARGADTPLCLAVLVTPQATTWWAGTESTGLWVSSDGSEFTAAEDAAALIGSPVRALAAAGQTLFIGTADAVYRYDAAPAAASPRLKSIAALSTLSLAVSANAVLIGTDGGGVFLLDGLDGADQPHATGLQGLSVTALACVAGRFFAGTRGAGAYTSTDASTWTPAAIGVPATLHAFAADAGGTLYAAAETGARLLDKAGATTAELSFSDALELPAEFAPELSQGFVSDDLRKAFARANVTLPKSARATPLAADARWLLSAQDDPAATPYVVLRTALGTLRVMQVNTLPVVTGAWPDAAQSSVVSVDLVEGDRRGSLTLGPQQWLLCAPRPGDNSVSEVRRVATATRDAQGNTTTVDLESPLANTQFRSGLRVSANVVRASQGETVSGEILGSGNSSLANQRFQLGRAPLTFLPVPPPACRRSTLRVAVGNVTWTEVSNLAGAGPRDRVYAVTIDYDGRATLTFGDGANGARLPTGVQNVVATYRVGLGTQGDVAAGTLDVMLSPPPGIRSVTNPIPASRGVNPSDPDTLRWTVPRSARTANRVVSFEDSAALASGYPGVRQAIVTPIRRPSGALLQLSVAFDPSVAEADQAERCRAIAATLRRAQAQPAAAIAVGVAAPSYFDLVLEVHARAGAQRDLVATAALDTLFARWSPAAAAIGEDVDASAIEAVLQALAGVASVQVKRLASSLEPRQPHARSLAARPAHYDVSSGRCVPASLLALAPATTTRAAAQASTTASYARGGVSLAVHGASA